jgi:transcriptional regulator with PAS, ATPase and Fis domain
VKDTGDLRTVLGSGLASLLEHLDEGILVLDDQRSLRYVNQRARRLLGYGEDETIDGRCRLTTRGVDCQDSCPLTFALQGEMLAVESFTTEYRGRGDHPVALHVTIIPLRDPDGSFTGAVEILRSADPDPGFFAAGRSEASRRLRQEMVRLARSEGHLVVVGEAPARVDVAAAIHRLAQLDDALFHRWEGSWDTVNTWPPGTLYADGEDGICVLETTPAAGWRVIVGCDSAEDVAARSAAPVEILVLPELDLLAEDLPLMLTAWVSSLRSSLRVTAAALDRLCRLARAEGLERLQPVLATAVSAAGDRLEDAHIPVETSRSVVIDELLSAPEPLAALEERVLREVLERCGWRMQEAADRLGISRVTLWRKLKDHGIER